MSCPDSAKHAPVTKPTYPVPKIEISILYLANCINGSSHALIDFTLITTGSILTLLARPFFSMGSIDTFQRYNRFASLTWNSSWLWINGFTVKRIYLVW